MRKGLIQAIAVSSLGCVLLATAAGAQGKIGDESDGSRAVPVHLIPLYDEAVPEFDKQSFKILPQDELLQPFSIRQTCGKCHTYEAVAQGWHFNAPDPNVNPGRAGQPWILADAAARTQVPVSYRPWPNTFRPEQLGLTNWKFARRFARHMPGGGPAEMLDQTEAPEEMMRSYVSGKLEINCLGCHSADPGYDQAEYVLQTARQNYRWAPTAACSFASVTGVAADQSDMYDPLMSDAIKVTYRPNTFDYKNRVLFDIVRKVPNERCYFCHSNFDLSGRDAEKWKADEDVHLAAGLSCVDCHRNGLDHSIIRGYQGEDKISNNPLAATTSCQGCHLGPESSASPVEGRLGAPRPKHLGIPPIHFEKMTCTACHGGPWPDARTHATKTSRAHALGTLGANKSPEALPHIWTPVFAKQPDGKIAPHKLFWPAFWAVEKDDGVTPIPVETARELVGKVIPEQRPLPSGDWLDLSKEQIAKVLSLMSQESSEGRPVYVAGGKLYRLDDSDQLWAGAHPAAAPSMWPIAHNVRPAVQSLGVRSCQDCHATDAPFFFGDVEIDSPLAAGRGSAKMIDFQDLKPFYVKAFAFSFVFRPWLKLVILASCAGLAGVLVLYALRALACVVKVLSEGNGSIEKEDE
ncbi:MAG TPA: cytochrome c3 family protein [Sedimentisphaerales bacterium]|nr:cytochrome c3 family protein [Sedimentisphaerales bacterium]